MGVKLVAMLSFKRVINMLQRRSITSVKTVKGLVFATFDGSGCSSSISACEKGCQWQAALDLLEGMEASRLHTGARN